MEHVTLNVCTDCRFAIGGYSDDAAAWDPIIERFPTEHLVNAEECPGDDCEECGDDCTDSDNCGSECGWDSFSMHSCDGCGSDLAGERFRAVAFTAN